MSKHTSFQLELPLDDTITISLTQGQETVIDAIDADLALFQWQAAFDKRRNKFTATRSTSRTNGKRTTERLHRIILSRMLGRQLLRTEDVDHEDLDPLNNRRGNLRIATRSQNCANKGKHQDNSSGCKGVYWNKQKRKWVAQIGVNNRKEYLGQFDALEEAALAYAEASKKFFDKFSRVK
jgi:HNH endonuclease